MSFSKQKAFIVLFILGFICIAWNIYLHLLPEKTTPWHYLYNCMYALLYGVGAGIGIVAAFRGAFRSTLGRSISLLGFGIGCYATGLFVWTYYNVALTVEIPYPSIADVFFIVLSIPLSALGTWNLLSLVKTLVNKKDVLEAIGMFMVSFIVSFGFIHRPDLSTGLPILERIMNIAYPLGDTILLTISFTAMRVSGGKLRSSIMLLVIGFFLQVIADYFYTYRIAQEIYWNGDISDVIFGFAAFFQSSAVITLADQFFNSSKS